MLRLIEPTSGSVTVDGQDVFSLKPRELKTCPPRDADHFPGPVCFA